MQNCRTILQWLANFVLSILIFIAVPIVKAQVSLPSTIQIKNSNVLVDSKLTDPQQLDFSKYKIEVQTLNQMQWKSYLQALKQQSQINIKNKIEKSNETEKVIEVLGPGTSGGGSGMNAEFSYLADVIKNDLKKLNKNDHEIIMWLKTYERLYSANSVFFVDEKLVLDGVEKQAINDYEEFVIVINKKSWASLTLLQKRSLIIHEIFGLAKSEDKNLNDDKYELTNRMLQIFDLDQTKVLLKDSDFLNEFQVPDLSALNQTIELTNLSIEFIDKKTESRPEGIESGKYQCKDAIFTLKLKHQKLEGVDLVSSQISVYCPSLNYGFTMDEESEFFEIYSGNLLKMSVPEVGSFIVGWISSDNIFIRGFGGFILKAESLKSPQMKLQIEHQHDGSQVIIRNN